MGGVLILLGLFSGILLWGDLSSIYIWFLLFIVTCFGLLVLMMIIKKLNLKIHLVFHLNLRLLLKF